MLERGFGFGDEDLGEAVCSRVGEKGGFAVGVEDGEWGCGVGLDGVDEGGEGSVEEGVLGGCDGLEVEFWEG